MEEWRQSEEFPSYDISSEGKVRNRKTGRILKTNISDKGYETVSLSEHGTSKTRCIHKLVADAYIPNDNKQSGVMHKDGDNLNNQVENLEWGTKGEIARRSYENGRTQKHRNRPIRCIETGEVFESIEECSKKMNINKHSVCKCVNNIYQKTKDGYHFKPLNN